MTESFALAAFRFVNVSLLVTLLNVATPAVAEDLRLLMFDQPGCVYCRKWDEEIGPIYPKTAEAERAPLTRIGIRDALPGEIALDRPAILTPTFVLLEGGSEVGRIEGYPGEDFFWFLLSELFEAAAPES